MRRSALTPLLLVSLAALASHATAEPPDSSGDYNLPAQHHATTNGFASVSAPEGLPPDAFARLIDSGAWPPVVIVTADRDLPLWRRDTIPTALREQLEMQRRPVGSRRPALTLAAQPGEFRVFQLGVIPVASALAGLDVRFAPLIGRSSGTVPAENFRCLTVGGIGSNGWPFRKSLDAPRGAVQPLWIGVDIPRDATGIFDGSLLLHAEGMLPVEVALAIDVQGAVVDNHGTNDAWRLSRLRWLDSTIGRTETLPRGFAPVRVEGNVIHLQGRRVTLGTGVTNN